MERTTSKINLKALTIGFMLLILPLIFIFFFYFFPLTSVLKRVFTDFSSLDVLAGKSVTKVVWFTLWQAFLSTVITVILGLPAAWIFSRFTFRGKSFFKSLFTVPFILPSVVTAAAFNALIGPRGLLNSLLPPASSGRPQIELMNTIWIILIAHVFYNISVVIRIVGNAWAAIDRKMEDVAMTLGASRFTVWKEIVLPMLTPSILSAALVTFLFDFTSYGVVLLLGGIRFRTIEVEISYQALTVFNLPLAGILSIIQMIFTVVITLMESAISRKITQTQSQKINMDNFKAATTDFDRWAVRIVLIFNTLFLTTPLLALFLRSILSTTPPQGSAPAGFHLTLEYYQLLFVNARNSFFYVPPIKAIWNSISTGIIAALIVITLSLLITIAENRYRWTRTVTSLFMFPLGTSAVTLGLGYLLFFSSNIKNPALVPIAHSLIGLPFGIRSIRPLLEGIPNSLRQAATILGATPLTVFRKIDIPLIRRGILNAGIFAFTISLGEFGATSFLSLPERPTIPIAIFRFLGQPGGANYGQAMAMSTILMVFCVVGVLAFERDPDQNLG
ncbi:MAG: iron ABC transporter permease [Chloroflexi bacterium]|nr:iron ABC transporter permease [Chloroflexota bacterium]